MSESSTTSPSSVDTGKSDTPKALSPKPKIPKGPAPIHIAYEEYLNLYRAHNESLLKHQAAMGFVVSQFGSARDAAIEWQKAYQRDQSAADHQRGAFFATIDYWKNQCEKALAQNVALQTRVVELQQHADYLSNQLAKESAKTAVADAFFNLSDY